MEGPRAQRSPGSACVCIIARAPVFGGTEAHTIGLIGSLVERGYRVELISSSNRQYDDRLHDSGLDRDVAITHTELDVGFASIRHDPGALEQWKRLLATVRSDVLILPKSSSDMGSVGFLQVCRRHFRRVFFIEHLEADPLPPRTSRRLFGLIPLGLGLWWYRKRRIKKLRASLADHTVAVSSRVKDRLTTDWGIAPESITVVRNGVRPQDFARERDRAAAFRAAHDLPADALIFGMMTRLTHAKGVDVALRALQLVVQSPAPQAPYLVIAGRGEDEVALRRLAEELGISSRVRFLGFVKETAATLAAFDVILFSSRQEGLPLGLLEGMAAGCIPIVTRISGMPEAVNDPQIGWVVQPDSASDLAAAMKELLALDSEGRTRMSSNAQQRIRTEFDVAECHRKILQVCGL